MHNRNIIAIFNWAEDKVTSSPHKMEMEANCLGHESPKVLILSTQNDHFEKCSFETIYSVPTECAWCVLPGKEPVETDPWERVGKG